MLPLPSNMSDKVNDRIHHSATICLWTCFEKDTAGEWVGAIEEGAAFGL